MFVDKDRNALVQTDSKEATSPKLSSTFMFGTDVAPGLSTVQFQGNVPEESATIKAGTMSGYSELNSQSALLLGDWKFDLPKDAVFNLNGNGRVQQSDKIMHAEAEASLQMPNPKPLTFSKMAVDGKWGTNAKTWSGTVEFAIEGKDLDKQLPVQSAKLTIVETGPSGSPAMTAAPASPTIAPPDVPTNIDFEMTAGASTPAGEWIKKVGTEKDKLADGVKQFIEGAKGKVESVTITKAEVTGDTATFAISIKARKVREAFRNNILTFIDQQLGNVPGMTKEVTSNFTDGLLAMQVDKLELSFTGSAAKDTAKLDMTLTGMDKFMPGYTRFNMVVQDYLGKLAEVKAKGDRITTLFIKWWTAIKKSAADVALKMNEAIAESQASVNESFSFKMEVKDVAVEGKGTINALLFSANVKKDVSNVDKVRAAMAKRGVVNLEKIGMMFNVKTDQGKLTGQMYMNTAGDVVKVIKAHFVQPAQQDPNLKSLADLLDNLKVTDSKWAASLKDGKFGLDGYVQTSDLTPIATAVTQKLTPSISGTPTGFRLHTAMKDGSELYKESVGFKQFMPGQAAGAVKTAVESSFTKPVEVKENADAKAVALEPALAKPDVKVTEALAAVKTNGDKSVFAAVTGGAAPETTSGGPGGGGAPPNTTIILAVVIGVLAILGIGFVATRKR